MKSDVSLDCFGLMCPMPIVKTSQQIKKMKVILHICCAVCASGAAERLIQEGYQVHGFFYNPDVPESRDAYDVIVKRRRRAR